MLSPLIDRASLPLCPGLTVHGRVKSTLRPGAISPVPLLHGETKTVHIRAHRHAHTPTCTRQVQVIVHLYAPPASCTELAQLSFCNHQFTGRSLLSESELTEGQAFLSPEPQHPAQCSAHSKWYVLYCVLPSASNSYVAILAPVPQNVTLFGNRVIVAVISDNEVILDGVGWASHPM